MWLTVLFICVIILGLIYLFGKTNELYWSKRGVVFHSENKVTGLLWDFLTKDQPFFQYLQKIYKIYPNEPAVGLGSFISPALYVLDPINIQYVLSIDFQSFHRRLFEICEDDFLGDNLVFLYGKKWKIVRQSMSPLFTTNKVRRLYDICNKSAEDFAQYLEENPAALRRNTFETVSTLCCEAIGATVFGFTVNSKFESPFLKMAQTAFGSTLKINTKFALGNLYPNIFKFLKLTYFKDHEKFFLGAFKQLMRERAMKNDKRNDFIDLCLSMQRSGALKDETGTEVQPTDELFAAQAFFFFHAGVEPCATVIFSTLLELGRNFGILEKVHKEIDDMFQKNHGKIDYDIVGEMKYLDSVVLESMRLYPPIGFLSRQCVRDTHLPNGSIKVDKGTNIFVPVYEVHHDERYYSDPETFHPDRFSSENKNNIKETSFMPFGAGNRYCIGARFAKYQVKASLIHLLRRFTVKTEIPDTGIKFRQEYMQLRFKNVDIKITSRTRKSYQN